MKRFWIGIVLLTVLLAGGIAMLLFSHRFYSGFSDTLEAAADAALAENWKDARLLTEQAAAQWDRRHRFFASFTDHEPVEEIELLLSRLALFQKAELPVDFADACEGLMGLCEAIDEFHSLNWWAVL